MKKSILSLGILFFSFFAVGVLEARAGTEHNATGWMWGGSEDANICDADINGFLDSGCGGDNSSTPASLAFGTINGNETGVGWISLNSVNSAGVPIFAGNLVDYGVNIPSEGDGPLSGKAWCGNLGWIDFSNSACPTGAIAPCNARRIGNQLAGYARVASIREAAAMIPSNSGGWEGFIDLSQVVIEEDGAISGQAWNVEELGTGLNLYKGLGAMVFDAKISPSKRFEICLDSCDSGAQRTGTVTMLVDSQEKIAACYNSYIDTNDYCNDPDGDVKADWSKTAGNFIRLIGNLFNSKTINVRADSSGYGAIVTATSGFSSASYTINVPSAPCDCGNTNQRCITDEYTVSCEDGSTKICEGTRDCGWREIAP